MNTPTAIPTPLVPLRLTGFSHGGGRGCTIAPGGLEMVPMPGNQFPLETIGQIIKSGESICREVEA
ncbi:MAG: hypothetical protein ABIQ60_12200 [Burkholderiaceae bacterium]